MRERRWGGREVAETGDKTGEFVRVRHQRAVAKRDEKEGEKEIQLTRKRLDTPGRKEDDGGGRKHRRSVAAREEKLIVSLFERPPARFSCNNRKRTSRRCCGWSQINGAWPQLMGRR
jgi:hypothetical protein